jgi:amino acid permease
MAVDGQAELSKPQWKQRWLNVAEVIDSLRVFPRLLVGAYFAIAIWVVVYLTLWYTHVAPVERTVEVTAFFAMLTGGLFGLATYIFKVYTEGGRDWDKYNNVNQSLPDSDHCHPPG